MKLSFAILAAMLAALPVLAAELPKQVSGPALVIDGDGLKIGEGEIRLFGIDAPEMRGGAEGHRSRTALEKLIADKPVSCEVLDLDCYKRLIATCTVAGHDLGEAMLAIGQAVTYRKFLAGTPVEDRYMAAERSAQAGRLGVWAEDQ
jgi:endonuclease YncB( thermonuclease family)